MIRIAELPSQRFDNDLEEEPNIHQTPMANLVRAAGVGEESNHSPDYGVVKRTGSREGLKSTTIDRQSVNAGSGSTEPARIQRKLYAKETVSLTTK